MATFSAQFLCKESISTFAETLKNRKKAKKSNNSKKASVCNKKSSIPRISTLPGLVQENFTSNSKLLKTKTRTLPSIKPCRSESFINYTNEDSKESLSFSLNKLAQIPTKKLKKNRVRITPREKRVMNRCDSENSPNILKIFENNNFVNEINSDFGTEKKIYRERNVSVSPKDSTKFSLEDPFYYGNIIKFNGFSSFHTILEKKNEMISNPFPYCSRIGKSPSTSKLLKKASIATNMSLILECKCQKKFETLHSYSEIINEEKLVMPSNTFIRKVIPELIRLHYSPQKVNFSRTLIIINFEHALGTFTSVIYIKSGTWKVLRKLSNIFQVILIIKGGNKAKEEILKHLEKKRIKVAGLYSLSIPETLSRQASKLQNYSQIFTDFNCKSPQKHCVIITNHNLAEASDIDEEFVGSKQGLGVKLNAVRLPIGTKEYLQCPHTILLPSYEICSKLTVLDKFAEDVSIASSRSFKETFDFNDFFVKFKYKCIRSTFSYHVLINTLLRNFSKIESNSRNNFENDFVVYCKLHNRFYVNYPVANPYNVYVLG